MFATRLAGIALGDLVLDNLRVQYCDLHMRRDFLVNAFESTNDRRDPRAIIVLRCRWWAQVIRRSRPLDPVRIRDIAIHRDPRFADGDARIAPIREMLGQFASRHSMLRVERAEHAFLQVEIESEKRSRIFEQSAMATGEAMMDAKFPS
jgi:hypothetical protein